MKNETLEKHFKKIGARVIVRDTRFPEGSTAFSIDIRNDKEGAFFDVAVSEKSPEFEILNVVPKEKHLLLYSRDGQRFLCGHDERNWFVSPIEGAVSTVTDAKKSLLPPEVWAQVRNLPPGEVDKRRNSKFVRQGEWFFMPTNREFSDAVILKKERIQRTTRNKPHICEELVREGGQHVYIVMREEFTQDEYEKRVKEDIEFGKISYTTMVRNPTIYVRGTVKHVDHKTIQLNGWHRVFINAELTHSRTVHYLD